MSFRGHRLLAGATLAGMLSVSLALTGCNKGGEDAGNASAAALPALPATLPMTNAPAQQSVLAPPPTALPATHPIRAVRVADPRAAYAYADQAGYFSQSLGTAPPDYGFDYDGVRPWAWQGYEGSRVFLEPVAGGYRYYYYRAGADRPYFIRDPDYAYGYDGDQLAAIYGPDGGLVPYDDYGPRLGYAAAYLWRAQRLFEASRDRQAISAAAWAERQESIAAYRDRWAANRDRQADWAAYHAEEAAQQSRYWAEEAARREADQQRFAGWRQHDFETPPPPRAIPPRWQQASWAQDGARYAPIAAAAAGGGALAWFAHRQQARAAERDVPRQQAFAAPEQPPASSPQPRFVRDGRDERPGVAALPPAERTALVADRPGGPRGPHEGPRQPPEVRDRDPAVRREIAAGRPAMRPMEPAVTVHEGNRAVVRNAPAAPQRDARPEASPSRDRMAAPERRSATVERPPEAPHRMAEGAQSRGGGGPPESQHPGGDHPGGDHPGGGHPAGGHPDGGDRGDRRR